MLLAIDIGNTNIVVGVYKGETLKDSFRLASRSSMTEDEAGFFITSLLERMRVSNEEIEEVVIGSVVPALTPVFEKSAKRYFGCFPVVVSSDIKLPITIAIDQPKELGADRIANSAAAFHKFGGPTIVVDFGTSTNFDIIDESGAFIGGVLCPGPETSMSELARRAARLFEIRLEKPAKVIGRSTTAALQSGFFHGTIGQIDHLLDLIIEETSFSSPTIVATGGYAAGIVGHSRHIRLIEPELTLEGLRLIGQHDSQ